MKRINLFTLALLCSALTLTSCKKEKKVSPQDFLRPATMEYSKQDTSNINYLVNRYAYFVGKNDLTSAAHMLYKVRHDSIMPLTEIEIKGFVQAYSQFPIYSTKLNSFVLRSDKNNQVDILLQIDKNGDINKGEGVMTMSVNPVVKDGKWYLTLMDKNAEGVENIYDPHSNSH
jgi:hypothetical protein